MNKTNTSSAQDRWSATRSRVVRNNWMFEIEPYSRTQPETLETVRDNLRLKKHLQRAVSRDLAPLSLIGSIRAEIRK